MGSMKSVRDRGVVQAGIAEAEAALRSARAFLVGDVSEAWERTANWAARTPCTHRADLLLAGVNAARNRPRRVTESMHRLAGTIRHLREKPAGTILPRCPHTA